MVTEVTNPEGEDGEPVYPVLRTDLPAFMARHHPIHGIFGAVFEEVGGQAKMVDWAQKNYTEFVKIFARMAPAAQADLSIKEMNIRVDSALVPKPPIEHE